MLNKFNKNKRIIAALVIYAAAMAMVEAAVVIYLRNLYYPTGFIIKSANNLKAIPQPVINIETAREAATIIMLLAVAYLSFSAIKKRIWAFLLAFSVWDLGYYLFLFLFIHWPASLAAIDVYFLLPVPLIGPVWFPILIFSVIAIASLKLLAD